MAKLSPGKLLIRVNKLVFPKMPLMVFHIWMYVQSFTYWWVNPTCKTNIMCSIWFAAGHEDYASIVISKYSNSRQVAWHTIFPYWKSAIQHAGCPSTAFTFITVVFFFHFCFIFTNYLQLNYWQNNNSYHPFFHRKGHGRSTTFVTMQDFDWISVNDLEVTHFSFRIRRWRGEMIYAFLIFVFRNRQGLGPIHLTCPPWKIVFNFGIRRCATPSLHSCLH